MSLNNLVGSYAPPPVFPMTERRPIMTVIIFDLFTPPSFEQEIYNNRVPEGIMCKGKYKTHDRIHALDYLHATITPYAHHLRILLVDPDDLLKFEKICHMVQCEPRPLRIRNVDAHPMTFFLPRNLLDIQRWTKTMEWKNAFQIEASLRCGLLNTCDLLVTLQKDVDDAILLYGDGASQFLQEFLVALKA
jgi:RNA-dependent RNA polymerase